MAVSAHDFLERMKEKARNTTEQGREFERLVQACLTVSPTYHRQYAEVWRWDQWARKRGFDGRDTGIDLVARTRTGGYCAIQCKFYGHTLQKGDIDSFLSSVNQHWGEEEEIVFKEIMVVSAADRLSGHAKTSLLKQRISGVHRGIDDLVADLPEDTNWEELRQRPSYESFWGKREEGLRRKLYPHQEEALEDVLAGFEENDRGKLIMACGTGKTLLSARIAEQALQSKGGNVLFLAPSLALVSQTLHEWSAQFTPDAETRFFAVCSDVKVGREEEDIAVYELAIPATTDAEDLAAQLCCTGGGRKPSVNVVFATYHSIDVVSKAQQKGAPDFALVICDEAHRTTGVEQPKQAADKKQARSYFTQVHDKKLLRADKRLYMTATPRIYTEAAKQRGRNAEAEMYSMDDEAVYGKEFHKLNFSDAVRQGLLSDYKVLILGVDEGRISEDMQQLFAENGEINLDDTARIVGCWNGLAKRIQNAREGGILDSEPMRRAVAFSQTIKASKHVRDHFSDIVDTYQSKHPEAESLRCEIEHVDGTQGAVERNRRLQWLRQEPEPGSCRILSNVRCLSEGVDVPALDAVLFLNPRRSMVDIVQSVGRVMRKAKGKDYGYVILPVAVPADMSPEETLNQSDNRYRVVWQVLQALRAHDNEFNAEINRIELNKKPSEKIIVDVIGVEEGEGDYNSQDQADQLRQKTLNFKEEWREAIVARMVLKCGDRRYWEEWAKDVAEIAQRNITRIKTLVQGSEVSYRELFDEFLTELRQNLNPEVSEEDAIEMLAQHLITKPVFEALFENYDFVSKNPVSKTMQAMLELLDMQNLQEEVRSLEGFYESVRERARGIDNVEGRQKVVNELYEKFFRIALPKRAESLGIIYTPIAVVDFILHSVDWLLRKEFSKGIGSAGVHILDPFTGTGTFINRLLQSSLIKDKDLERKFRTELHANEIILLAYYIAAINIEEAYHDRKQRIAERGKGNTPSVGRKKVEDVTYEPFEGIVLTDTFQINERDGDILDKIFPVNSKRVQKQQKTPIRVVLGNPPYSAWQRNANDQNTNLKYPKLDEEIRSRYACYSSATNLNSLYDSYIRAFRWASDRIGEEGIIAYVSNGGWLDGNAMDGLRKCLQEEFSSIYCFNLRGNQRTSGELSRREGGKIFGSGSRAAITILFLIKQSQQTSNCRIYYHDIGDYHNRDKKLEIISEFGSVGQIPWNIITPNAEYDWINQRNPEFQRGLPMGDRANKKKQGATVSSIFTIFSSGIKTNRDTWVYNFSKEQAARNMRKTINFYNSEVERYRKACSQKNGKQKPEVKEFINYDPTRIHWEFSKLNDVARNKTNKFISEYLRHSTYRPFCKQWLYFDAQWNSGRYLQPYIFPMLDSKNRAIGVSGIGATKEFSTLMVDTLSDLEMISKSQCFPRYRYVKADQGDLYSGEEEWQRLDNISSETVTLFRERYGDQNINGDAIFYYVYGVLHSPEYKQKFAADLKKMLPRIPYVETAKDFWAFSKAGSELAELHVSYEQVKPYPLTIQEQGANISLRERYRVRKMRFGGKTRDPDKSTIHYNDYVTIEGIPLETYEYVVNGKSAVEWIMERYQFAPPPPPPTPGSITFPTIPICGRMTRATLLTCSLR